MRKKYALFYIKLIWIVTSNCKAWMDALQLGETVYVKNSSLVPLGSENHNLRRAAVEKSLSQGSLKNQASRSRMKRSSINTSSDLEESSFLSCNDSHHEVGNMFTPTCVEIHNVDNISASYNISDQDLLRILRHELLFCKDKDICGLRGHYSDDGQPCCYMYDECSCADDCKLGGNCCISSVESFEELERVNSGKSCYRPQLFFNNTHVSDIMVYMVDTCKDIPTERDVLDKCIHLPGDFDQDPFLFIPVYSKKDKHTVYKNKYCALCNSHKEDDLVYWKIDVKCREQKNHFVFTSLNSLFKFVREDPYYCNILFIQPQGFGKLSPCKKADVETCPDIPLADPFYSKACKAYTSIYAPFTTSSTNFLTYKNVFCYLCNGNRLKDSPNKCINPEVPFPPTSITSDVAPFTILLDFNSLVSKSKEPSSARCSESQRYDNFTNLCRDLFCTNGLILRNKSCTSPLERESRRSYSIRYQLYNQTLLPVDDSPDQSSYIQFLENHVFVEFMMLFRNLNVTKNICRVSMAYVGDKNISSNRTLKTEYIAIDFDLEVLDMHTFTDITGRLLSLSGKRIIRSSANGSFEYEVKVSNISISSMSYLAPPTTKFTPDVISRTKIVMDQINNISENDTRCDVETVRYFAVTLFALCPKISLPMSLTTKPLKDGSICMKNRGCYAENSFQTKDEKLIICADDYFKHLPNNGEFHMYSEVQSVLSIVCTSLSVICLLFTLVTYAIFPVLRTLPGRNNMALISTLICAQILYQFGINRTENSIICGILGILIHFTWLASICWMNVCTYHMFHIFVWDPMRPSIKDRFSINKYLVLYSLYSYFLPLVFIFANVINTLIKSSFSSYGYGPQLCYISSSDMIAFTFALPVGILLLINLILFLVVIYKIQRAPKMKTINHDSRQNFFVFIKLSCITGLFWLTGFLYQWLRFAGLEYVFIILNAGQGVFIMFAFVCNKRMLGLYKNRIAGKGASNTSTSPDETKLTNISKTTL